MGGGRILVGVEGRVRLVFLSPKGYWGTRVAKVLRRDSRWTEGVVSEDCSRGAAGGSEWAQLGGLGPR